MQKLRRNLLRKKRKEDKLQLKTIIKNQKQKIEEYHATSMC
jgi:hypothetical protein